MRSARLADYAPLFRPAIPPVDLASVWYNVARVFRRMISSVGHGIPRIWRAIMKVMAIGTLKPLTPEQRQTYLPKEVTATLQLYLDGKMEQFWMRDGNAGVIFLMSVDSVAEADTLLKALPLGQADLLTFDLMPIGPLAPLGMLIH
jgi:muconolactone delta-isomerase